MRDLLLQYRYVIVKLSTKDKQSNNKQTKMSELNQIQDDKITKLQIQLAYHLILKSKYRDKEKQSMIFPT